DLPMLVDPSFEAQLTSSASHLRMTVRERSEGDNGLMVRDAMLRMAPHHEESGQGFRTSW
ncbi:MAG TPA: hypothetical protein VHN11_04365, partial [Xanthobacteraceae bacterium]|nr:hypothetical protein [Xanthobacteraceae bacterium]